MLPACNNVAGGIVTVSGLGFLIIQVAAP